MARLSWSVGPATSLPLRVCWYAGLAVWGGFALLALGIGVAVAAGGLVAGDPRPALFVGLLLLVGGPLSVLYLWPMLADPAQRPAFLDPPAWLDYRVALVTSAAFALGIALVPVLGTVLFVGGLAAGFTVALLRSEGAIDPDGGTLTVHGRTADFADLTGVSRADLGRLTVLWLRYARGRGSAAPRLIVLPRRVADRASGAIETGVHRPTSSKTERRESSRAVRLALATIGLGALGVGASLFVLGSVPTDVALWAGAIFGLFGLLFCWLAYRE